MFRSIARPASIAVAALALFSACSDQSVTGVEAPALRPRLAVTPARVNLAEICSQAGGGNFELVKNAGWANPVANSVWIGKAANASTIGRVRLGSDVYTSTFAPPPGATDFQITGRVLADNDVVITAGGPEIFNSFTSVNGPRTPASYPTAAPDNRTIPVFSTSGGRAFSGSASSTTVTFTVYNDDDPNVDVAPAGTKPTNPSGVSFCYTASYQPAPEVERLIPMFVIGDVEPHAVGDNVNFWGAQWWKNNDMSGVVSNGVASFKGYATEASLSCGGTWISRPGNSSNPPATISSRIAVIVTSKVIKNGPDISGDIKQIVLVDHDGGYGPNPGHRGNGIVKAVQCGAQP